MSDRLIVVGVDGSDAGRRALLWAVREADERERRCRRSPPGDGITADLPAEAASEDGQANAERLLRDQIASLGGRYRTTISTEVVEGRAADVLSAAARDADLLVIGSHGHSRVWTTVLGSVGEECVLKASCPVASFPSSNHGLARRPPWPFRPRTST